MLEFAGMLRVLFVLVIVFVCSSLPGHGQTAPKLQLPRETGGLISKAPHSGAKVSQRFLGWHFAAKNHQDTSRWIRDTGKSDSEVRARGNARALSLVAPASTIAATAPAGFESPLALPAGYIPTAVVHGDFNEDGKTDLAFSNGGDNTIYVLLGNGDGTFKVPEVLYTSGQSPVWLAAAKFRASGHVDLVAVDADSEQVELFTGNGDGTFQPGAVVSMLGQTPTFVVSGDFNGDGNTDLAIGLVVAAEAIEPQFVVLLGDGSGAFPTTLLPPSIDNSEDNDLPTNWMAVGDLNNDGRLDVVTTVEFGGALAYLNQGSTFQGGSFFGPIGGAVTVALADMDGDGCLDAVETGDWGLLTIANGACDGSFAQGNPVAGDGDIDVAIEIADVDGDGNPDIVASSAFSDAEVPPDMSLAGLGQAGGYLVSVLKGDGNGGVLPAAIYRVGPQAYSLAVADLNGDGRPEIVTVSQTEAKASLLVNDGSGGFGQPSGETIGYTNGITNNPLPSSRPQTVDLNGDGKPDVLMMEYGVNANEPAQIAALLNNGSGKLSAPIRSAISVGQNVPYPIFTAAKFRDTSPADLIYVTQYFTPSIVAFFPGNGDGTFGAPTPIGTVPNAYQIASGDFNGDQTLDFAVFGYADSSFGQWELDVFLGNGDGTFKHLPAQVFSPLTSAFPQQLIAGDSNHDGKLDLLIGSNTNNGWVGSGDDLDLAAGNGDGTFQAPTTLMSHFGPVAVADLNHDGYLDLVQARDPDENITNEALLEGGGPFITPALTIYLGGPGGVFSKQPTYDVPGVLIPSFAPALVGDFNGDGNLDVALPYSPATVGRPWEESLQIFQGTGDGSFLAGGIPYQLPAYDKPAVGGDFRGVGITDLLDVVGFTASVNTISGGSAPALRVIPNNSPLLGDEGSATVELAMPARASETVALSSSDSSVALPSSLTFNAGDTQKSFSFSLGSSYDSAHVLALTASLNGAIATGYVAKANPNLTPGVTASLGTVLDQTSSVGVTPGNSVQLLFTLQSVEGYSGVFSQFICTGLPAGATCSFAHSSVALLPGGFAQVAVDLSTSASQPMGVFNIQVQASNGEITPSAALVLGIGDYHLNVNPGTVIVNGTEAPVTTVSADYIDGFGGDVSLACSGLPDLVSCSIPSILYPASPSITFSVVASSPSSLSAGDYAFEISGKSGTAVHSVPVTLRIENFKGSLDKDSARLSSGGSTNFKVTLTSLNHFSNADISISCQSAANVTCSIPGEYIALNDGSTASTQLTVTYKGSSTTTASTGRTRGWMGVAFCCLVFFLPFKGRSKVAGRFFAMLLMLVFVAEISACGGGSSTSGGGTSPGSQTVTVSVMAQAMTGSGMLEQNVGTITLTVPQ